MTISGRSGRAAMLAAGLLLGVAPAGELGAVEPIVWEDCTNMPSPSKGKGGDVFRVPLTTPYAVQEMIQKGEKVELVDVRSPEQFKEQHLAGARNVPFNEIYKGGFSSEDTVVLYCAHCCCPEVSQAAKDLLGRGHRNFMVLRAGLEEIGKLVLWQASAAPAVPERLIELGCGEARREIKTLLKKIRLQQVPPIEFQFKKTVIRSHSKITLKSVAKILEKI